MHHPTGTVTFLFTDIEGSTRLAQKYPEQYSSILQKHDMILEDIIEINNGFIFNKAGDSVCAGFDDNESALNSAIEIQRKLKTEFHEDLQIKVRMGIHRGEAEYTNSDYLGYVTLSRVQRIMSISHGGQILITKNVYDDVRYKPNNFLFKDFGLRKLKDIILPENVFQVYVQDLQSDFPPVSAIDARQNNIPVQLSKFIGREKEISELATILGANRLLSLTGSGGTGKTRLAMQLASGVIDEFDGGVWVIELSPIINPELIVNEIANVLSIKEEKGIDILQSVKNFLKEKNLLLILDNSEHLLNKCSQITSSLLSFCRRLKIISTSREPFDIPGEFVYRVPPLSLPVDIAGENFITLSAYESVRLFNERANEINSTFKLTEKNIRTVAELCKRLDGIPLAIELAAKRINVLTVESIFEKLSDRFKLLTAGTSTALPRQKTLRAMIDWSYDLLNLKEQTLLQRLSIFQGGWTIEAAEEICTNDEIDEYEVLDLMNSLLNKSLIVQSSEGIGRFTMLDSINAYAFEKLTDNEDLIMRRINYYIKLTDTESGNRFKSEDFDWIKIIAAEKDNIRATIDKAVEIALHEAALLCLNMFDFWVWKGNFSEGFETITRVYEKSQGLDELTLAKLMEKIAELSFYIDKPDLYGKFANESLTIFREHEFTDGMILALNLLGQKAYFEGDADSSMALYNESLKLCDQTNSIRKGNTLLGLSMVYSNFPDGKKAVELKEEALELFRNEKNIRDQAYALIHLSIICSRTKQLINIEKAIQYAEESGIIARKMDDKYLISITLIQMGSLHLMYLQQLETAEYILLDAYEILKQYNYKINLFPTQIYLGLLYLLLGKPDNSEKYYNEYLEMRDGFESEFFIKDVFSGLAKMYNLKSQYTKSAQMFGLFDKLSGNDKYKSLVSLMHPFDKERTDTKEKLGEEEFNKHYEKGRNMKIEDVIF